MRYRFGTIDLDVSCFELRIDGVAAAVEPQVLALLLFLVGNRDRLVTRDEIIDSVWNGRIVSDAAVSSRIKSARQLIGDDGTRQQLIRTVHGRGFRFVGTVDEIASPLHAERAAEELPPPVRPSIAVLPLAAVGELGPQAIVAEALPHEIIRELSRLRWLFVIARASSFRFGGTATDVRAIGQALGVRYLLAGTVEIVAGRLAVSLELADTDRGGVVWADRFDATLDTVHELRAAIVAKVVAALELRIPVHEAARARLAAPGQLDAWSAYHLGLQRMFRFTEADNAVAAGFFADAIRKEPDFARAHAGLSFVRFQDAFLDYADPGPATEAARAAAERAVALDPLDPFANVAIARAHWLSGDLAGSIAWLDRAAELSPNYAQGSYARAWAQTLLCRGDEGQRHADRAMALSPLDPLRYAMLATRALSHFVRGDDRDAADWGERAAREPGAHALIAVIAAACHAEAGDPAKAKAWIAAARHRQPTLSRDGFFRRFPFDDAAVKHRIARALDRSGL